MIVNVHTRGRCVCMCKSTLFLLTFPPDIAGNIFDGVRLNNKYSLAYISFFVWSHIKKPFQNACSKKTKTKTKNNTKILLCLITVFQVSPELRVVFLFLSQLGCLVYK